MKLATIFVIGITKSQVASVQNILDKRQYGDAMFYMSWQHLI